MLKAIHKQKKRRAAEGGFTILEMLVAVSVLGISMLGLAQLLGVAVQQNDFARYNTAAIQVARGKLEELKAHYNRQLETGVPSPDLVDGSHGPETVVLDSGAEYYGDRTLVVRWQVESPKVSRKDIQISVTALGATKDISARNKTVTINTSFTP